MQSAIPPAARPPRARTEALAFAIDASSLGLVLVARAGSGIAAILLGDDRDALEHALRERFPRAALIEDLAALRDDLARVTALVEAPASGSPDALALDPRGTAFQRRVWDALRAIPAGTTVTYAQIATRIGVPTAVRAVAQACAANPLAVVVPCHRVVRSDGALSGYRWGVARKRTLLAREAAR
jgi:AraC family transcriptional regulator of adaptative response/methylated-DNA-[protein]-cysteine methyltransferase